jgi:Fe-S cluster assembly protein SufD
MPTNRNEEYRFTDIKPLLQHSLAAPPAAGPSTAAAVAAAVAARPLKQAAAATVVVVDGVMDAQHSSMAGLPAGVYVGGLAGAPQDVVSFALVSCQLVRQLVGGSQQPPRGCHSSSTGQP